MADDDRDGGVLDDLKERATRELVRRKLERLGDDLLDGLETMLLGGKGRAEEILAEERRRGTGLDRVREELGIDPDALPDDDAEAGGDAGPAETPRQRHARELRERALEELAALKRRRAEERGGPDAQATTGKTEPDPDARRDLAPDRGDPAADVEPPPPRGRKRGRRRL